MVVLITITPELRQGDFVCFNKDSYLWHKNERVKLNLQPFPEWDRVVGLKFEIESIEERMGNMYRGGYCYVVRVLDDTICKGLSRVPYYNGTVWVLHSDWKKGECPHVFFRKTK